MKISKKRRRHMKGKNVDLVGPLCPELVRNKQMKKGKSYRADIRNSPR